MISDDTIREVRKIMFIYNGIHTYIPFLIVSNLFLTKMSSRNYALLSICLRQFIYYSCFRPSSQVQEMRMSGSSVVSLKGNS